VSLASITKQSVIQLANLKVWITLATSLMLSQVVKPRTRRVSQLWFMALLCVFPYAPISPRPHAYLNHPFILIWSINVAVLVGLLLASRTLSPQNKVVCVLLVIGLGVSGRPQFCNPYQSLEALKSLCRGEDPFFSPAGYVSKPEIFGFVPYPWDDYHRTLDYLRKTPPNTRVANALLRFPAITGPCARLPAFPAESLAWLQVQDDAQNAFARSLEDCPDSVVVWVPNEETPHLKITQLASVIRRLYEPGMRFGVIEVWRRKASSDRFFQIGSAMPLK
jgi:hypothetical protein